MKAKLAVITCISVFLMACGGSEDGTVKETRTSGTLTMLVDETFADIIDEQVEVFKSDYPDTKITLVKGPQGKILPAFLNDSIRMIIMPRELTAEELKFYEKRKIPVNTDRFAMDGVALITNKDNIDTNITVDEIVSILQGKGTRNLVFDNPYSSTLQYCKDLAKIKDLPATGVSALKNSEEVISFVAQRKGYIGVVGLNWLLSRNGRLTDQATDIVLMNVKNIKGGIGDDAFYKPRQSAIMRGKYPLYRNVYVINAEGRDGLGTGFATWLTSERGQLIVLNSGLGPDREIPRDFNLKSN